MSRNRTLALGIVWVWVLSSAVVAQTQGPDLSRCISKTFLTYDLSSLDSNSQLAVLMSIQKDDYHSYQTSNSFSGGFKNIIQANDEFKSFDTARSQYAETHQQAVQEALSTSHLTVGLKSDALHTIEKCMDDLSQADKTGLRRFISVQDQSNASVTLQWYAPIDAIPDTVTLSDSFISNGVVLGAPAGKVFTDVISLKNGSTFPVSITRTDPTKAVTVSIITGGHKYDQFAYIEPYKLPEVPQCGAEIRRLSIHIPPKCCTAIGNHDGILCPWSTWPWIPLETKSDITVTASFKDVDLSKDLVCPGAGDPHRRGGIIVGCGTNQSILPDPLPGVNFSDGYKQSYSVSAYCKSVDGQPVTISVTATPRGCTNMQSDGKDDSVTIVETRRCE